LISLLFVPGYSAPQQLTDPDAYAVYAAVLPAGTGGEEAHATKLLVQQTTEIDQMMKDCPLTAPDTSAVWAEAIEDFKRQNASTWMLQRSFPIDIPYVLESKDAIMAPFKAHGAAGWSAFNAAHPDSRGFIHLSAVGFDKSRTRAIVYVSHFCGGLCGSGMYRFVERQDGTWKERHPTARACSWIS
jgi:hypothetical protein